MTPSELDSLLNSQQFHKAPPGLTKNIMKAVREISLEDAQKNKPFYYNSCQTGLRLVAAGLLALLLSLSPITNRLMDLPDAGDSQNYALARLENITETIDYYTVKVSSMLTKPINIISRALNKED
jgi:hypothetical protein